MNIKKFVYFAILIFILNHINNSYCPIFTNSGFRVALDTFNHNLSEFKTSLEEYEKDEITILAPQTFFNEVVRIADFLKPAADEMELSTPVILFFQRKNFLPPGLEFKKTDPEAFKKTIKATFLKFIDDKIKELKEKLSKAEKKTTNVADIPEVKQLIAKFNELRDKDFADPEFKSAADSAEKRLARVSKLPVYAERMAIANAKSGFQKLLEFNETFARQLIADISNADAIIKDKVELKKIIDNKIAELNTKYSTLPAQLKKIIDTLSQWQTYREEQGQVSKLILPTIETKAEEKPDTIEIKDLKPMKDLAQEFKNFKDSFAGISDDAINKQFERKDVKDLVPAKKLAEIRNKIRSIRELIVAVNSNLKNSRIKRDTNNALALAPGKEQAIKEYIESLFSDIETQITASPELKKKLENLAAWKDLRNQFTAIPEEEKKSSDEILESKLNVILQRLKSFGIPDVPTANSFIKNISQSIAGKNIIEWIDDLNEKVTSKEERGRLTEVANLLQQKLVEIIKTNIQDDKYLIDILETNKIDTDLAVENILNQISPGKTLLDLAKAGTTPITKNILELLKIRLNYLIRDEVLKDVQLDKIFGDMVNERSKLEQSGTPIPATLKQNIINFVKNYNTQIFGPIGQEKTLLEWVNQDEISRTKILPLLNLKGRIG